MALDEGAMGDGRRGPPSATGAQIAEQYRLHHGALLAFVRRQVSEPETARDIAAEVYLRVLRLGDPGRMSANPRGYLFTMALNIVRDRARRAALERREAWRLEDGACMAQPPPTPEEALSSSQTMSALGRAFNGLDEKHRRVFLMSRVQQCSYAEISQTLGISVRSVERYMSDVLTRLRQELEPRG